MYEHLCGNYVGGVELTFVSHFISVHLFFFYTIAHLFDKFQNCATMNCQRNVNCILPTQLPHKFSYIVAILIHNHFELPNITNIFIAKLYQIVKKSKNVLNFKLPES
jgi:hypothetical protein